MDFLSLIYQFISEYIAFPITNLPELPKETNPQLAALTLRERWGLGEKPIDNIVYYAEQNGIIVTSFETSTNDVDAFSQLHSFGDNQKFLIAYSKNKTSAARVHFDVAHELGHILLHEWSEDIESLSKEDFQEREQEANDFAAAFLLPSESFVRDLNVYASQLPYYTELKRKWKVSIAAMIRRAYSLKKIDYNTYQRLMRTMQKNGIRKEEPLDDVLFTAPPTLLKTAINMLLEGEQPVFTPGEFISELSNNTGISMYGEEIEHLLDLPKGTLAIKNNIVEFPTLHLRHTKDRDS
jgi:Zn-dependent peptidase ImmA (M78 family)